MTCAGGATTEASAPFSRAKRIAHSVFMFYSMLHALYPCGFTHTPQGGAIEGNPARRGKYDALMVNQGRILYLTIIKIIREYK